ncbi:MAG: hypothetical protein JNL04_14870 [Rhodospirillaceae bacterium]|nr:hypothetical protein [Rhodospirillaceae bacterium]
MELGDLVNQVSGFDDAPPREKILLFAWFLHTHRSREIVDVPQIRACFSDLHIADPSVSKYVSRMVEYGELVKAKGGFKLERTARNALDAKYGVHYTVVQVSRLLGDLPGKVPDLAEKNFLSEAIRCYRIEAYRACIVMTWNLAYSHLLHWILSDATRLSDFNIAIGQRFPRRSSTQVSAYDSFLEEFKESEVIEICSTAGLLNSNVIRLLREKLGKRNTAAHPASVIVVQSQADDVITDLVNNVVLSLR